jgi:hypothetical protein
LEGLFPAEVIFYLPFINMYAILAFINCMAKRIIAYHFAFLVLLTNTWVPIFTHVCHGQNKTWSSVLVPAKSCCSKQKDNKIKACHLEKHDVKNKGIRQTPCCENRAAFLHEHFDYSNAFSPLTVKALQKALPALGSSCWIPLNSFSENIEFSFRPHAPPLKLHGRSLLIFEQIFLC